MIQLTHFDFIMTVGCVVGWTVAFMQFIYAARIKAIVAELKQAIKSAITEHKLECIQDVDK